MLDANELSGNQLFQALTDLRNVDRQGILTVDVTELFTRRLSGVAYATIVGDLAELGISRPSSAVPPPRKEAWMGFEYDVLRKVPGNKFKPFDRIAIGFSLSADDKINVIEAAWLNTAAYP